MTVAEIPWVIDEHTRIKHALLTKYIDPWMAIFFAVQSKLGAGLNLRNSFQKELPEKSQITLAKRLGMKCWCTSLGIEC
jgi:hypothetical protein